MPGKNECVADGIFTFTQVESLYQRARTELTGCEHVKFPQRQPIDVKGLAELPSLDGLDGLTITLVRVGGVLPAAGQSLDIWTDVLTRVSLRLPNVDVEVRGHIQDWNWIGSKREYEKAIFEAWLPMLLSHLDAAGREPILQRLIKAANLPASTVRKTVWRDERIEYANKGQRGAAQSTYSDRLGALSIRCHTNADTPAQQIDRVRDVLNEFQLTFKKYEWRILELGEPAKCLEAYRIVRDLNLFGTEFYVDLYTNLTELIGLDSLHRFVKVLSARKQWQTVLCRFPLPSAVARGRKKLGKILIRTGKDGHRVSLTLPDADDVLRTSIAGKLGLTLL